MDRANRSDDQTKGPEPAALCEPIFILNEELNSRRRAIDKPVLLLVGHWAIPTGFRRVLESLVPHLAERFEVHFFAINKFDEENAPRGLPVTVHRNRNLADIHDPAALNEVLAEVRPALLLVLDEPWACARLEAALRNWPRMRSVFYLAVHGRAGLGAAVARALAAADRLVTFTEGAATLLHEAMGVADAESARIAVIPHGVDTGAFRPLVTVHGKPDFAGSRLAARQLLFPERPEMADAFIVLNANRNQPFKRIDLCLEGFAEFARGKPWNVFIYLHMASRPAVPGEIVLVDQLGIRNRVLPASSPTEHPALPDDELNIIYNACDVGINTSVREGWGLVSFEHAAAGAAQIVPDHTACAELWAGCAMLLETEPPDETGNLLGEWFLNEGTVKPASVAAAVESLYSDGALRAHMAQKAYENAMRPEYRWEAIGERWCALLEEELARVGSSTA
jgi:D-inositol-3-phosphate glycosyltransferase